MEIYNFLKKFKINSFFGIIIIIIIIIIGFVNVETDPSVKTYFNHDPIAWKHWVYPKENYYFWLNNHNDWPSGVFSSLRDFGP